MNQKYETWSDFFAYVKEQPYCKSLAKFINQEYELHTVYPPRRLLFNAFRLTPLDKVKVVIIGQDPYHEPREAMGLSFSVPRGVKLPPSLFNIYKEIESSCGIKMDYSNGDLTYLAKQGVLLLNTILTVREHEPLSHNITEYRDFIKDVLETLDKQTHPIIFMLWGSKAIKLKMYLNNPTHLILESGHPSPLSANRGLWFGNNHFRYCNDFLLKSKLTIINWSNLNQK